MLTLEGVDAGYGRVQVLRGLSFEARAGEVTCVMGRNGAGKTTMLRAIMGQVAVTSGRIRLDGAALEGLAPHRIPQLGIGHVPQGRRLFGPLTVAENLEIGLMTRGRGSRTRERVLELFRVCASGWIRPPRPSRAASSRCWPSAAPSASNRSCCFSMSRPRACSPR